MHLKYSATGVLLFAWGAALAQTASRGMDTAQTELNEVRVTETRMAGPSAPTRQTAVVLTARRIQYLNPSSTADLLIQSGAAFVQKSQGGEDPPFCAVLKPTKSCWWWTECA